MRSSCKPTADWASYASSYNIILAFFSTEERLILVELTTIPTLEPASEKLAENLYVANNKSSFLTSKSAELLVLVKVSLQTTVLWLLFVGSSRLDTWSHSAGDGTAHGSSLNSNKSAKFSRNEFRLKQFTPEQSDLLWQLSSSLLTLLATRVSRLVQASTF